MLSSLNKSITIKHGRLTIILVGLLGFNFCLMGQLTWNKSIDYNNELNHSESVFEKSNGEFIIGVLTYPDSIPYQGALLNVNSVGNVEWSAGIEEASHGFLMRGAYQSIHNQIWSLGIVNQDSEVTFSPIIVSCDSIGKELWRKVYDYSPYDVVFLDDVNRLDDTTMIVFFNGTRMDENSVYHSQFGYSLIDSNGNEKYRRWLPSNFRIARLFDAEPFPQGGYMISIFESNEGNGIPFEYPLTIKRLDDLFGVIWERKLPFEEQSAGRFSFDQNKNIYMTWAEDPSNPDAGSPWGSPSIISYNQNGGFRWKHTFDDNPRNRQLGNIITTSNGQIISVGLDEPGFPPLQWGWIVSIDTSGSLLWDRKYTIDSISPNFGGFFGGLIESSDNNLVVAGYIHDKYPLESFAARDNVWLLKTDLEGCIDNEPCIDYSILTKVKDISIQNVILDFKIMPNPVNNILNLEFSNSGEKHIDIYSPDGSLIFGTTFSEYFETIYVNNYVTGLYFIRVFDKINNVISVQKFIKL